MTRGDADATDEELKLEAIELVARLETAALDARERQRVHGWRRQSERHARAWRDAEHRWRLMGEMPAHDEPTAARAARQPGSPWRAALLATAAGAAAWLIASTPWQATSSPEAPAANVESQPPAAAAAHGQRHSTRWGERRRISLGDGSAAHLNFESTIDVLFDASARNVRILRGEVLFEVAPDVQRPFVVSAGDLTVTAVGTAFVVRRLAGGAARVTVVEGRVDANLASAGSVALGADDSVESTALSFGAVRKINAADSAAWRSGLLVFRDTPLQDVLAEIGRYTPYRIDARLGSRGSEQLTGTFFIERIDEAVDTLIARFDLIAAAGDPNELRLTPAPPQRPR